MRVYFAPCGVGLGHAGRSIPVAKRLVEEGHEVLFSTYSDAVNFVKNEGLPIVRAPPIGFVVKRDGSVDFRATTARPGPFVTFTMLRQISFEIEHMRAFKPDAVFSDTRASSVIAARLLDIPRLVMLNQYFVIIPRRRRFLRLARFADAGILTMVGRVWTMGSQILIPDLPEPYTISAGNLRIPERRHRKVRLIGPILPVRPESLPSKESLRAKLSLERDKPLIFAPISGSVREKALFSGMLQRLMRDVPDKYRVVMTLGYPGTPKPVRHRNLTILNWVPNRYEFLKACDLVVSRPGHGTLLQSLCYGKPLLLVPTPLHTEQFNNAARAIDLGVARMIEQQELTHETLTQSLGEMIENNEYTRRAEAIQRHVSNLDAIKTVIQAIGEALK